MRLAQDRERSGARPFQFARQPDGIEIAPDESLRRGGLLEFGDDMNLRTGERRGKIRHARHVLPPLSAQFLQNVTHANFTILSSFSSAAPESTDACASFTASTSDSALPAT